MIFPKRFRRWFHTRNNPMHRRDGIVCSIAGVFHACGSLSYHPGDDNEIFHTVPAARRFRQNACMLRCCLRKLFAKIIGVDIVAAHDLLEGLAFESALARGLGDIPLGLRKQPAQEAGIELLQGIFFCHFIIEPFK